MQGHLVFLILALSVAFQTVWAQNLSTCLTSLLKSKDDGVEKCTAWKEYLNCYLWGRNADTIFTTDEEMEALQNTVDNEMYTQGIYCSINVRDILSDIEWERKNGVTRSTARPLGFDEATRLAECSIAKSTAVDDNGAMSCDIFTSFMKCYIRVENWYYQPSEYLYEILNDFMHKETSKIHIHCDMDARELVEEVAEENGYTTLIPKTTTEKAESQESIERDSYLDTDSQTLDSFYDIARTVDDCRTISGVLKHEVGLESCPVLRSGLKCIIRVSGVYKVNDPSLPSQLQDMVDSAESRHGLHCAEDMDVLLQEVRQEQGFNYRHHSFNKSIKSKDSSGVAKFGANVVITFSLIISVIVSLFWGAS